MHYALKYGNGMEFFLAYVLPVLIFSVMAALFGFLLSYLSVRFAVERNPKLDEVLRELPNINCGGCGETECARFAEKLAEGKADLKDCYPLSKEKKDRVAEILDVEAEGTETIAVVSCAGGRECADKFEYRGYGTCATAEIFAGGKKACTAGCIAFGTCADVCNYNALTVDKDKGYAVVKEKLCISCGACMKACPKGIISRVPKSAKVFVACLSRAKGKDVSSICKNGCTVCGTCVRTCEADAIILEDGLPEISYSKCTGCKLCAEKCPSKVIRIRD
jgi:electron transport complex protein RnfB